MMLGPGIRRARSVPERIVAGKSAVHAHSRAPIIAAAPLRSRAAGLYHHTDERDRPRRSPEAALDSVRLPAAAGRAAPPPPGARVRVPFGAANLSASSVETACATATSIAD